MTMTRRNIFVPDELWEAAQLAALEESVRVGRHVSVAEWVREAMQRRLDAAKGEAE